MYLAPTPLRSDLTDTISYLDDGDWVVLSRNEATVYDDKNAVVEREIVATTRNLAGGGELRYFMAKEIHEQPEVVGHTLAHYVDMAPRVRCRSSCRSTSGHSARLDHRCGTASMRALSRSTGSSVWRVCRSNSMSRPNSVSRAPLRKGDLAIFISQSVKPPIRCRARMPSQACTHLIVNVPTSTIARRRNRVADAGRS